MSQQLNEPQNRPEGMSHPIAAIIRFNGDPDDVFERFEKARRLFLEAQGDDHNRPAFYAACKRRDGIVIVGGWESNAAQKEFGRRMRPQLEAVGLGRPDQHEHMWIEKLGWE
ncbi:MAG: hypothetical protein ACJ766_10485 [Thermoleophilaceae bacterium]